MAFLAIYLIWGSTYLAIKVVVTSVPAFLSAAIRFLVAGILAYGWLRWRGHPSPSRTQWRAASVVGLLLLLGGNGLVSWAEMRISSGVAALLVAFVPIWIVVLDRERDGRPSLLLLLALAAGLLGIFILIGPEELVGAGRVDLVGAGAVVLATISWAIGTLRSRRAPLPPSPFMSTAAQMLAGGAGLLLASALTGELGRADFGAVPREAFVALAYLIVFGSFVALSAYVWLLRVQPTERVATYAYVNPMVAVLLGAAILGEPLTPRVVVASVIIVLSVGLIVSGPRWSTWVEGRRRRDSTLT
jgi:drug/metabolite transporter (DMT)-like permease